MNGLRENTELKKVNSTDIWKMGMKSKMKIAVVCGGYSGESVVSMRSAAMVMANIDRDLYDPIQVVIEQDRWYGVSSTGTADTILLSFARII